MPRFQPPGEEPLSATAPRRGEQAASGGQADWVSQGRARGSPQPPSRTWVRWGGGRGGDSGGVGARREGAGKDQRGTKRRGRGRDARGSHPEVSGCDWRPPAARGGGPGGFGTGSAAAAGAREEEVKEEEKEEEAGRRADQRAGGRVRSAKRRPRRSPTWRQVSSRPSRPASPPGALGLPAPAPAPGAHRRRGACRASQLGSGDPGLLAAGGPRPGTPGLGSTRPPRFNFAGTRVPLEPRARLRAARPR